MSVNLNHSILQHSESYFVSFIMLGNQRQTSQFQAIFKTF